SCRKKTNWLQLSNLQAAFAESAASTGLESATLFKTFGYEISHSQEGVNSMDQGAVTRGSRHDSSVAVAGPALAFRTAPRTTLEAAPVISADGANGSATSMLDPYSPNALSFIRPVLTVRWPLGVLLPPDALLTYREVHCALFRHHLAMHRLRRLRVALRERLFWGVGSGGRAQKKRGSGGTVSERLGPSDDGQKWDEGRLHWMHLFRHELQHMADCLQQGHFIEQTELGWPDLCTSLSYATAESTAAPAAPTFNTETPFSSPAGGLAFLTAAHARYISGVCRRVFLGKDRAGVLARAKIEEFYSVVCDVSGIIAKPPTVAKTVTVEREGGDRASGLLPRLEFEVEEQHMSLPDSVFKKLVLARGRFDVLRKGLCDVLAEEAASGASGEHARSLTMVLGYWNDMALS
ncbi:unnamed protein product, partial [Choristocarpus tenellus]